MVLYLVQPQFRLPFLTAKIDDKIFAIGGYSNAECLSSTELYDPATNKWTSLGPLSNARYFFQSEVVNGTVYVIGGNDDGASSALSSVEAYTPASSAPTITVPTLTATAGDSQVNLSWTAVDGAAGYNVYRSTTSGGPYTKITSGITGTAYTDTGVTNGTTYYYVVTAVNTSGTESACSNEASATPAAAATCSHATIRITMVTGEVKEYQVTSARAAEFVNWFNGKAANCPMFIFEKPSSDLGPYKSGKEYLTYDKISSFEIIK